MIIHYLFIYLSIYLTNLPFCFTAARPGTWLSLSTPAIGVLPILAIGYWPAPQYIQYISGDISCFRTGTILLLSERYLLSTVRVAIMYLARHAKRTIARLLGMEHDRQGRGFCLGGLRFLGNQTQARMAWFVSKHDRSTNKKKQREPRRAPRRFRSASDPGLL